jgi:hypothetical protein
MTALAAGAGPPEKMIATRFKVGVAPCSMVRSYVRVLYKRKPSRITCLFGIYVLELKALFRLGLEVGF